MPHTLTFYRIIEAALGRSVAWRLGRFLYLGARRELLNDPTCNGEYALVHWVLDLAHRYPSAGSSGVTFLDVGANIGDWTETALGALGDRGLSEKSRIYAFEPAPSQHSHLIERFKDSIAACRLHVQAVAVGAAVGKVSFSVTGERTGTSSITSQEPSPPDSPGAGAVVEVACTTVDHTASAEGLDEILLMKVDTEGNDFNVILGSQHMLDEGKIGVIQFEYNWRWISFGHYLKTVFDFIADRDYVLGSLTQTGVEVHSSWHPELDRFIETNFVLVRRDLLQYLPCRRVRFNEANTIRWA